MSPTGQWIAGIALALVLFYFRTAQARTDRDVKAANDRVTALELVVAKEVVTKSDCQSCKGGFTQAVDMLRQEARERDKELFGAIRRIELAVVREFPNADIGGE